VAVSITKNIKAISDITRPADNPKNLVLMFGLLVLSVPETTVATKQRIRIPRYRFVTTMFGLYPFLAKRPPAFGRRIGVHETFPPVECREVALPKKETAGGVSDADYAAVRYAPWSALAVRGRRSLHNDLLGKAPWGSERRRSYSNDGQ
jgi:hypothetical protein